jgi:hypothetical protein
MAVGDVLADGAEAFAWGERGVIILPVFICQCWMSPLAFVVTMIFLDWRVPCLGLHLTQVKGNFCSLLVPWRMYESFPVATLKIWTVAFS